MLEEILKLLENGPVVLNMIVHHGQTSKAGKYQLISADSIGIVVRVKSTLGSDFGGPIAYPWSGVAMINLAKVS